MPVFICLNKKRIDCPIVPKVIMHAEDVSLSLPKVNGIIKGVSLSLPKAIGIIKGVSLSLPKAIRKG